MPIQNKPILIKMRSEDSHFKVFIQIGKNKRVTFANIESPESLFSIPFDLQHVTTATHVINNAGGYELNGLPQDRGLGEFDHGQYQVSEEVDFLCGVSMLVRRQAIINRPLFVSEYFAYYEDAELSRWLRGEGYTLRYVPRSMLYHRHSETLKEGSSSWFFLTTRAQCIFQYKNNLGELSEALNHIQLHYKSKLSSELAHQTLAFNKSLIHRLKNNGSIIEYISVVGIYNRYWNTKGGGESHALSFASVLQKKSQVFLVSETDFSIEELEDYFSIDLSNCRKMILTNFTSETTRRFDFFINATFQSELVSFAKKSFYIVFFPQRKIPKQVLNSYKFLYMNKYTRDWGLKYWGKHHCWDIIRPLGMLDHSLKKNSVFDKQKILLSVGRFFTGAHSKRQDLIAKAFSELSKKHPELMKHWKLVLVGSLDEENDAHVQYHKNIKITLQEFDHVIEINASRSSLRKWYDRSYGYIHASGLEVDIKAHPEKIEHFGITLFEAMSEGCNPAVFKAGGPHETLQDLGIGVSFGDENELGMSILKMVKSYEQGSDFRLKQAQQISEKTIAYIAEHHPKTTIKGFLDL
jgi:glycosyltransferase involved in cell wall biosynthesis